MRDSQLAPNEGLRFLANEVAGANRFQPVANAD